MVLVPRDALDETVMDIARNWVDVLATGDYETVATELGYLIAFDEPSGTCIRRQIESYRSPDYYPGVDTFTVTSWRTAKGGYPAPRHQVTWFEPNDIGMVGVVVFDLPLNGKWSDLTAYFVYFDNKKLEEGYVLCLEEIKSVAQMHREQA